jgi:pimeloyl-ACP methyl ester carboxylesterase
VLLGLREIPRYVRERPRETAAIAAEVATAGLPAPTPVRRLIVKTPALRRMLLAPYVFDPIALPGDAVSLIVDGAGARGAMPTVRAVGRSDPTEGLELVRCPILSLAGDSDRISPPADTEAFQREASRARTVMLEGCGHMLMLERPRAFNAQLHAFAQELR